MRNVLVGIAGVLMLASAAWADLPVETASVECNWGLLTMEAVLNGFDQGGHASDPSGDGRGPGSADEPRAGLANVVERGNLQALCEFLEDAMSAPAETTAAAEPFAVSASVECNWGLLTMEAIRTDFDQGGHSSDPSGDGYGPDSVDEPRAGLANVVEPGNLQALCEFLAGN